MKTRVIQSDPDKPSRHPDPADAAAKPRPKTNLAGRMGGWSARHRKTAIFGWLAFVVVAFALGIVWGTTKIDQDTSGVGESGRADRILDAGFKQPAAESVLIESKTLAVTAPAFQSAIEDVVARVSNSDAVQNVRSPLDPANAGQIAENGRAALVEFEIRGPSDDATEKIDPVLAAVDDAKKAHPELFIGSFGDASADKEINGAFMDDLKKAGILSLPVTLIILVLVFGALVAAGIPLLLALTAIVAAFGLVALPSSLVPIDETVYELILLIGLAVGVDYSMFYLKREREERAAGRSSSAAVAAAAATSGRSVLISGVTVIIAMAGMFLAGVQGMSAFAVGTIIVVAIAMLGSLTVLPALLCSLGDRVERGRVPLIGRLRNDGESRIWGAIVDRVLRRPLLSVVLAGGLLVAIAVPALQLRTVQPAPETFPQDLATVQTYNRLQKAFPGGEIPANVIVQAPDVNAPDVRAAIGELEKQALASDRLHGPVTVDVNERGTIANIAIPVDGTGVDAASKASLAALRDEIVPATVGALPNAEVAVTGYTAASTDFTDKLKSVAPLVFGFVLLLAFGLLLAAFRSLVIAVKAILLNLLSVAAAYGVLVLVFQHGWGKGILGFESTAGIDAFLPIFLFVILFGLSMDYHVFILSRIREAHDRGMDTDQAVANGIKTTAGVVTSAAIVMVCVFSVFATLSIIIFKQFGVGLAAAILIDATIVRAVLLPATMKLLGEWNWYLPRWLEWLPQVRHETAPAPEAPEAPAVPATS
ncbi:MAG: MMPL family transporter [Actinomycetota bacterium]|nr:MMPL family transporter [Actinomycetota bacterium]